ncbi:hypothetical protein ABR759_00055 [Escherichia coli]
MKRNATQRNATQRNATQRNATQRNATQRNATQRNATQRNATICLYKKIPRQVPPCILEVRYEYTTPISTEKETLFL